jgi:Leucine-rich repeat (LRR) protein
MDPSSSQLSRFPEIVDRLYNAATKENLSPSECSTLYQDIDKEIQLLQAQPEERMRSICNDTIARFDKRGHNIKDLENLKTWLVKHTFKDDQGSYHGAQPAFQNLLNCISKIHHSLFESERNKKDVSYLDRDPFEGEELVLFEYVGASALEQAKNDSSHVILNIGHRWFEAAKGNLNTSDRMQLFADTEKAIECFYDKKMKGFVLNQFYDHPIDDWEALAKWIGENTGIEYVTGKEMMDDPPNVREVQDLNFTGAYPIFHELVKCFSEKKDHTGIIFEELLEDSLLIDDIDAGAMLHIENKNKDSFNLFTDIQKLVFSDLKQLKILTLVSKDFQKFAKDTLVQYINESKFTFRDLGFQEVDQIINFFGPYCKGITRFNFTSEMTTDKLSAKKISESFPEISYLVLNKVELDSYFAKGSLDLNELVNLPLRFLELDDSRGIKSLNFLNNQHKLESLVVSISDIEDLQVLSLCPLKHLSLDHCFKLKNYEFLKDCKSLETVSIKDAVNKKIDGLKFCPSLRDLKLISTKGVRLGFLGECKALETLHLQGVDDSDFLFLKNCSNLHTLKFYGDIYESRFLFEMPALRKLYVLKDSLTPSVIESLQKKGVEVITE